MYKKLTVSMVSLLACFAGTTVFGATNNDTTSSVVSASLQEFKLQPAVNLWGYSGNNTLGEGQILAPIYGDSSKVLYGLAEGNVAVNNDSWLGGGGIGYRQVVNNERIFGGYALVDYSNTANNNGFWVANPGLEMLGQVWDINVNGYLPFGSKKKISNEMWADTLFDAQDINSSNYIRFTGHDEYAHKFKLFEEAGSGFGLEVGRVVPYFAKAKFYLGGYHFGTSDAGVINGAEARLTYGLNKYTALEVKNFYDNVYHNQTLLGVKLTLGGYSDEQKLGFGISSRLMDPVDNDFARLSAGTGVLTKNKYIDLGEYHEHDNLWFFEPATAKKEKSTSISASGDGTYENPFIDFTPANSNAINPKIGLIDKYPLMYFAPGQYSFEAFSSQVGPDRFDLPSGWGMYGRSADYRSQAMGDERPLFNGGLDLNYQSYLGQATTTVDSIRILSSNGTTSARDPSQAALYAYGAFDVVLRNIDISNVVSVSSASDFYLAYGIYAKNSSITFDGGTNTVSGSTTNTDNAREYAAGIAALNSVITFKEGINIVSGSATGNGSLAYGIDARDAGENSTITFNGGNNNIYASATGDKGSYAAGVGAWGSTITFSSGTNIISGSTTGNSSRAFGIDSGYNEGLSSVTFNGGNNNISGSVVGDNGCAAGIAVGETAITFDGGTNIISGSTTGNGSRAFGIDSGYNGGNNNIAASVKGDDGNAAGIVAAKTNIIFKIGTNIISGTTTGIDSAAAGIVAEDSTTITFDGGANVVSGSTTGTGSGALGIDSGYNGGPSTITFNGGNNNISASATGDNSYAAGIAAMFSTITFNDGTNIISGSTTGNSSAAIGIDSGYNGGSSTITFNGGNNNIAASATAIDSTAYGIYAGETSTINFANLTTQPVSITANGTNEQYGIYADSSSSIQIKDTTLDDFSDIKNYATFVTKDTSIFGYAAYWDTYSSIGW